MSIKNCAVVCLLWLVLPCLAQQAELRPDHPDRYVVKPGDTLWDISGRFLTKPWLWPEIWHVNPQVANPHLIYPGDVLTMAWCDGKPCLQVARGRDVKLSPAIRAYEHGPVPPIPLDAIGQFLSRPRVVGPDTLKRAPYILSSQDQHLVAGSGNKIYVRGALDPNITRYTIFRGGEVYVDPDTDEVLGYEALHVGDAILQRVGDPATALVTRSNREVLVGDRLLPEAGEIDPAFYPHPPAGPIRGKIISVIDGVSQIGQYQVAILNLGEADGMDTGTVLAMYQSGIFVRDTVGGEGDAGPIEFEHADTNWVDRAMGNIYTDVRDTKRAIDDKLGVEHGGGEEVELPEERLGELMIFRTFERVSYALVMNTQRPAHVRDVVTNP
jgi:hypothetical protein